MAGCNVAAGTTTVFFVGPEMWMVLPDTDVTAGAGSRGVCGEAPGASEAGAGSRVTSATGFTTVLRTDVGTAGVDVFLLGEAGFADAP